MTDIEKLIEKLQEMKLLENCFLTSQGTIDLMEMSRQLPESVFREYTQFCQAQRNRRTTHQYGPHSNSGNTPPTRKI